MGLLNAIFSVQVEPRTWPCGIRTIYPYFMRPVESGDSRAYEVVERATGKVYATYNQRGVAAQTTNRLNGVKTV